VPRRKPATEGVGMRKGNPMVKAAQGQIEACRGHRIPALRELIAPITPENRYSEIPSGPARGKESVDSQFPTTRRGCPFSS
jgi:hypothetical protein